MSEPIVEVEKLTHTYRPQRRGGIERNALENISFPVERGEIFGLLGPNGGGKTTLFKILSTLLKPTDGTARILGADVRSQAKAVRRHLGVAFQSPSLDKKLTVFENLMHQGHLYGFRGADLRGRIEDSLGRVRLSDQSKELVETLSGGMCRRVELAKTLLHHPEVLLLDEPSTGLDPGARRDLWAHLKELQLKHKVTVLLTTHLMEEAELCDRLAILHQGHIVALGTPAQLKSEIGGDVISIQSDDAESVAGEIRRIFHIEATVLGNMVHIEYPEGHKFIPQVVEALPGRIRSLSLGKPTLEDVFIHRTGHRFWNDN